MFDYVCSTVSLAPAVRRWSANAFAACALFLSGCASDLNTLATAGAFSEDLRLGSAVNTVCFSGRLSGFRAMGAQALVMYRTRDESYLVQTAYCPKLRHVEAVGLLEPSRCLSRGDRLVVDDTPFPEADAVSARANQCLVTAIHAWDENQGENNDRR